MNPEAEAIFQEIQKKPIDELTENDKAFLRARSSYLGKNGRKKYEAILSAAPVIEEKKPTQTEVDPNAFPPTVETPEDDESDTDDEDESDTDDEDEV